MDREVAQIEVKLQRCPEVVEYVRRFGQFSATNSDHVLKLMDKVCGREEIKRSTRNGVKMTTDEEALASIPKSEVPSAALILEHRGLEKLSSTYIRPVVSGRIISSDGMIHAKYSSMTAETGRLSSEDPNAQNWPSRKHKQVRGTVAARKNRILAAFDYGQIEFRVAGMASEDQNLVKYSWTGYDVHGHWATRIVESYPEAKDWVTRELGVDWDKGGMKALRQEAKNKWVFPSIFGAAVRSRAANLQLPEDIAAALDREFWDEFPDVKKWQQRTLRFYEKHLYVETLGGIRRRGPLSPNQIINMPIQGTAAEIVTAGMDAVSELALINEDLENLHPVLNVHDDLTFEMWDGPELEKNIETVAREMCQLRFSYIITPLIVEVKTGKRWNELKEIKVFRSNEVFGHPNPYR
jgi:DNA polymerase-1